MNCLVARQLAVRPVAAAGVAPRQRCLSLVVRADTNRSTQKAMENAVRKSDIPSWLKPSALVALTNALAVLPAHAEAGKIFDFNATLPIMVGQFLLLMFFLDKFWFGPVGKVLDERDALIRNQLGSVKEGGDELEKLQAEAERILAEARAEAQKLIADARAAGLEASNSEVAKIKEQLDKELAEALATLETEKTAALKDLSNQVNKLSGDILARILPADIKI
eukprot:jgi/Botrbrau1/16650/Bobra.0068s0066.1